MAIVKFTEDEIKKFKIGCPILSKIDIGTILNNIIDAIDGTSLEEFTDKDKKSLDNMCLFNGIKLGSLIFQLREACGNLDIVINPLEDKQISALNNTCNTLKGLKLGDKIQEIIETLTSREKPIKLQSLSIPTTLEIDEEGTGEIKITFVPENATNKEFTIDNAGSEFFGATPNVAEGKRAISGILAGSGVLTITPTDNNASAVTCTITVTTTAPPEESPKE